MSKPPKQSHLDYLLTTIEKDHNPEISKHGSLFKEIRQAFADGLLTENEVRTTLGTVKKLTVAKGIERFHAEKLMSATIDYIIKPDFKIS